MEPDRLFRELLANWSSTVMRICRSQRPWLSIQFTAWSWWKVAC